MLQQERINLHRTPSRRDILRQAMAGGLMAGLGMLSAGCGGGESAPATSPTPTATPTLPPTRRVLIWSERTIHTEIYPNDVNGAVAAGITPLMPQHWQVFTAHVEEPEQGLSAAAIDAADVIVWFAHVRHGEVTDAAAEHIARRVRDDGMGFIALHSGSWGGKPFQRITGHTGDWTGGAQILDESHRILVAAPNHPIARNITDFTIPEDERFLGTFQGPPGGTVVFDGIYQKDGIRVAQGIAWTIGNGRVFYFRPGHETFPVYFQPEVRQVLRNAALWTAGDEAAI